jgi:hypothetical protein
VSARRLATPAHYGTACAGGRTELRYEASSRTRQCQGRPIPHSLRVLAMREHLCNVRRARDLSVPAVWALHCSTTARRWTAA